MNSTPSANGSNFHCERIQRKPFKYIDDKDFQEGLARDFKVLPLFEKKAYDFSRERHYSLVTNELLSCRWKQRIAHLGELARKRTLKQFPNVCDYHFYNCCSRFMPSQSIQNMPPPRLSLIPGPGVDSYGPLPIPDDMMLRKTKPNKNKKIFI